MSQGGVRIQNADAACQTRDQIDLGRLCAGAGAGLIVERVTGVDVAHRQLVFDSRPPIPFDVLVVGIGSVPARAGVVSLDDTVLAIKPMQTFLTRLEARLQTVHAARRSSPLRIAVVGGGAGGAEITFCVPNRVRAVLGDVPLELTLIDAGQTLIPGATQGTSAKAMRALKARHVRLVFGRRVTQVIDGVVMLATGEQLETDLTLWCTGAAAPPLLGQFGFPTDDKRFLLTRPTLCTTADASIFAVGDSGTIENCPMPKAGVHAVRQGPVLWENIHRVLDGRPLREYKPQKNFMKLFNTGDGRAIGEYKGFSFHAHWVWKLKNRIDRKFITRYQN